jgi:hypothetical protein
MFWDETISMWVRKTAGSVHRLWNLKVNKIAFFYKLLETTQPALQCHILDEINPNSKFFL